MFHVLTLTYVREPDAVDRVRPDHRAWIQREVEAGRLLLAGQQESKKGGVLITADISSEDAEALAAQDPYSQAGVVSYERLSFNGGFKAPGL
jgi:uncharacterized protein YciI